MSVLVIEDLVWTEPGQLFPSGFMFMAVGRELKAKINLLI